MGFFFLAVCVCDRSFVCSVVLSCFLPCFVHSFVRSFATTTRRVVVAVAVALRRVPKTSNFKLRIPTDNKQTSNLRSQFTVEKSWGAREGGREGVTDGQCMNEAIRASCTSVVDGVVVP